VPAMRRFIFGCCLFVLGCGSHSANSLDAPVDAAPPATAVEKDGSDWPRFLGPFGTGVSPETGIIKPWPKQGLRVVWQRSLGSGYGAPTISQGRLFQFDRLGDNARLRCLKSSTGEPLWRFEYPSDYDDYFGYDNGPRCCPVVDGDRVYIYGAEGMLHCLRTEDGKLLWKVDTRAKYRVRQNFFGIGSTPVIEGDLLIVQVGGSPANSENVNFGELKGDGSGVIAFDKKTGDVKWQATDELASYASPVLTTIGERRWCFVFARGGLLGLDPANGKVDFHYPWRSKSLESVNASNPVVVGDKVFITECYGPGSALLKVKPGHSEVVWNDAEKGRNKALQCHWNTPIHRDGYIYGSSGRHTNEAQLRCVELATGKVMWSERGLDRSSLTLIDGHFLCLGEYGELLLLKVNSEKFEEVSRMTVRDPEQTDRSLLEYPCWAAPVVSHGLLYVRGKGRLVCLELIPRK
jgi:outer membrane protein assembly factor BamB